MRSSEAIGNSEITMPAKSMLVGPMQEAAVLKKEESTNGTGIPIRPTIAPSNIEMVTVLRSFLKETGRLVRVLYP